MPITEPVVSSVQNFPVQREESYFEKTGRYRFLSFKVTQTTFTISFNTTNQATKVYWGDGAEARIDGSNTSHTYTNRTIGEQIMVEVNQPIQNGISSISVNQADLQVFWESLTNPTLDNINLTNLNLCRSIDSTISNTVTTIDLRNNNIGGDFPDGLDALTNMFIQNNNFEGALPTIHPQIDKYQVNGNRFRGPLPDISGTTSLVSFLVYNQSDDRLPTNDRVMLTGEICNLAGTFVNFYHVGAGASWAQGFRNELTVASDFDVPTRMSKFYASNCTLSSDDVDQILTTFAAKAGTFNSPNIIDLSGNNGAPSSTGLAAKTTLESNGWTVNVSS
jgi:hypothetical protein